MAATHHNRGPLKCKFNTFYDGILLVSGMVMYRDEYFVYTGRHYKNHIAGLTTPMAVFAALLTL